jgi:vacuolar-type H+-ATPase subunit E/Vma4
VKPSALSCEVKILAYYNEDALYRYFDKAIKTESDKRIQALRKEIDYLYAKEIKSVTEELTLKKNLELNKELREMQIDYQDQINKIGVGYDAKLIKERTFMTNIIFQEVLDKIQNFTLSKAYDDLMRKKLEEISDYLINKKVIFRIAEHDKRISKLIESTVTTPYEIETTTHIHLGGFEAFIVKDSVEIDETIDTRLKERKDWFYRNSKLFIRR